MRWYNVVMIMFTLLSWWYHQGWLQVVRRAQGRLVQVAHLFSLPILIRTLGAPWRRIITYPGESLDDRLRAFVDNLVSRAIGFTVRLLVLVAAGLILFLTAVTGGLSIILWPLVPIGVIGGIVKGIVG